MKINVLDIKCIGCGICEEICPFAAIEIIDQKAVINDNCTVCGSCIDICPTCALESLPSEKKEVHNIDQYRGVWVFAEQRNRELLNVALELLGEGKKIASQLDVPLTALLLGHNIENLAPILIQYGADKVLMADHKLLEIYTTEAYTRIIHNLIQERKPEVLLIGATTIGRDLAPRLAARSGTGLTADCTHLEVSKENRNILQTRPAFGGNLMATIICPDHRPQMSTIRPGVMEKAVFDPQHIGEIEKIPVLLTTDYIKTFVEKVIKKETKDVAMEEAPVIVAGGRGLGCKEGFELLGKLAKKLGGTVGATRAAVEAGWISEDRQIGLTGKTVQPRLYIACGISGAAQHVVGMQKSGCIVAVNSDPEAEIFEVAEYGIVGDLYEVIPELIKAIE